ARKVMPGGDTRTAAFFAPYPAAIAEGEGAHVIDADGNQLLDLLTNYSSLILGHRHPHVMTSVNDQLGRGIAFAAPNEAQVDLASEIVRRIPSLESLRFTNSGTEAAMWAIRCARAFTARSRIVKAFGGYHGSYDLVDQWFDPPVAPPGGLHDHEDLVVVVDLNDIEGLEAAFARHAGDIAAIILEPVLGSAGVVAATREYLGRARSLCAETNALLIFDEVITFRLSAGGAQVLHDIRPDLTILGKIIGGGFPVGAFGGRSDVMQLLDPAGGAGLVHSGTFNGNPLTMTAGLATLEILEPSAYSRLDGLGANLQKGFGRVIDERSAPLGTTRAGSLLQIHPQRNPEPPRRRTQSDTTTVRALHMAMFLEGVHLAPRGFLNCSLVLEDCDVEAAIGAFGRALERIKGLF
ncbi:MAG: aspartate aminotransferase family protein, partial [Actinomycetota bacterium]|nr:aspartate aminotransferase family protein [Actinomycetota bacterium]